MDKRCSSRINVIATGFIVLVLYSLVLFWGRFLFFSDLINTIPSDAQRIAFKPSGLIPGEPAPKRMERAEWEWRELPGPNEPNFMFSEVSGNIEPSFVISKAIGAFWDIEEMVWLPYDVNEKIYYYYKDNNNYLCLDRRSGLLINCHEDKAQGPDGGIISISDIFAGPNGVSLAAGASLGRFYDPLVGVARGGDADGFWLYDREFRQFYFIDFIEGVVKKGLQLDEGDSREPVEIETIGMRPYYGGGGIWSPPQVWNDASNRWERQRVFLPGDSQSGEGRICSMVDFSHTYVSALDKTGRIYIYNSKEQTLTSAGYLPRPASLFASEQLEARPEDVLNYQVVPIYAHLVSTDEPNKPGKAIDVKYLGMKVNCVSREGTEIALAVFDPNGRIIYHDDTGSMTSSGPTPLAGMALFLLENLQPMVFEAAAFLCGDCIEASAGHRALFILPNSFVGMLGRYRGIHFDREVFLPVLMGPSLILSVWLALRVRKDATLAGLSGSAKKWWIVGTIALGLPAYITYRLTRPKETLVTCQNCGNMRRPDMEKCHRCGSKWDMPELTPPNWRIRD